MSTSTNTSATNFSCFNPLFQFQQRLFIDQKFSCDPGFYCPNVKEGVSLPEFCPPTPSCLLGKRLFSNACEAQGLFEPVVCPPGFYCPDWKQMIPCPTGYYCPSGSVEPKKCLFLSACDEGTSKQSFYGGVIICLIIDIFLVGIYILLKRRQNLNGKAKSSKNMMMALPNNSDENRASDDAIKKIINFYRKGMDPDTGLEYELQNASLKLKGGKTLLSNISTKIGRGSMVAVMGPSGCGKTTLTNVLMGRLDLTEGSLLINGSPVKPSAINRLIGYVPQEDIMIRELTVRENILHSALIRLPQSMSRADKEEYVDLVIEVLGLGHVAHSLIGDENKRGISGGQRKRVNIALELAAMPLAILLDEPTSGLDATSSLHLGHLLKNLTEIGITIISVIHQPRIEIFYQFDEIVLLMPGGHLIYSGPTSMAQSHFQKLGFEFQDGSNPADIMMDILSGRINKPGLPLSAEELSSQWHQLKGFYESGENTEQRPIADMKSIQSTRGANFFCQIWYNLMRSMNQQFRLMSTFWIEIAVGFAGGALMGLALVGGPEIYRGSWKSPYQLMSPSSNEWVIALYGMLVGMTCAAAAAPAGTNVISNEKHIYWREAASGHSRLAYYIAKNLSVIPRFVISSFHFTSFYYFLARPLVPFSTQYAIIFFQFFCVYGLATIFSAGMRRESAPLVATITAIILSVFNGFGPTLLQVKDWGILFIWEMSYNKWATEAQFSESVLPFENVYNIQFNADAFGYTLNRTSMSLGIMVLWGLIARLVGFFILRFSHPKK